MISQSLRLHRPSPALQLHVQAIGEWEVPDPATARTLSSLILPALGPILVFHYRKPMEMAHQGGRLRYRALVSGPQTDPSHLHPTGSIGSITCRLTLAGGVRFFGPNLADMTGRHLPLDLWLPASALEHLAEALAEAATSARRIELVEAFLLSLPAYPAERTILAAAEALRRHPALPLHDLSARLDLSEREVRRRFLKTFALPPKRFAGVARIERLIAERRRGAAWADAAYAAGYFDQAHMIHDFRRQIGPAPQRFWQKTHACRHAPEETLIALSDFSNYFFHRQS